jgi:8-oxo-dGTP pyrophosphatase MutT (NUDIX family)
MKRKVLSAAGKVAFIVGLPLLYVYMWPTRRTRVVVACGDDVLVMKAWLGSGRWILPGGGLHRGEDPAAGATRELYEETGIKAVPKNLRPLFHKKAEHYHTLKFAVSAFALEISAKPKLNQQQLEVAELVWLPGRQLLDDPRLSRDAHQALHAFYAK